jgi:nitrogen fixation protein FixH
MTAKTNWVCAIVGLLAANIIGTSVLIGEAHHGASRVLPAYYERAVHYDDTIDQAAKNHALAWSVTTSIHAGIAVVIAHDSHGAPIEHARVRIDGSERAEERAVTGELVAVAPGEYRARVGGAGWVDLTIAIERGDDRFVRQLAIEAR